MTRFALRFATFFFLGSFAASFVACATGAPVRAPALELCDDDAPCPEPGSEEPPLDLEVVVPAPVPSASVAR